MIPFELSLERELDREERRFQNDWLFKWHNLNIEGHIVDVDNFDGSRIRYSGIRFEGQPQQAFWQAIGLYLSQLIHGTFERWEAETRNYPESVRRQSIGGLERNLRQFITRIVESSTDTDRRLRGRGHPQRVAAFDSKGCLLAANSEILQLAEAHAALLDHNVRPKPFDLAQEAVQLSHRLQWDVFVSHASEDKDSFARPLATRLREVGLRVWFDEFTLAVGDSLRRSIDHGLAKSRFGIVVISPAFLDKHWPQQELDGLVAREVAGIQVILPVWHNIDADQVREYSPILADRLAVFSKTGLENVVKELVRAMKRNDEASRAAAVHRLAEGKNGAAGDLVALGPGVICLGEMLGSEHGRWSIRLRQFLIGEVGAIIKFIEQFDKSNLNDRYVVLTEIGDGRRLGAPPSLAKDGNSYIATCPVVPSFPRVAAQDLQPSPLILPKTNDLVAKDGNIALVSGVDALDQNIRHVLSMIKGESPFHPTFGSRLQEYYWQFRGAPFLKSIFKLEVTRQA
jgi:hypothetical protein